MDAYWVSHIIKDFSDSHPFFFSAQYSIAGYHTSVELSITARKFLSDRPDGYYWSYDRSFNRLCNISAAVILLSIISICLGVFGYMTFWDVNLDAVSMISIIMSIGFAVDLSAHITYAFVTSHGNSKSRVIAALETLGWPIFQVRFTCLRSSLASFISLVTSLCIKEYSFHYQQNESVKLFRICAFCE